MKRSHVTWHPFIRNHWLLSADPVCVGAGEAGKPALQFRGGEVGAAGMERVLELTGWFLDRHGCRL